MVCIREVRIDFSQYTFFELIHSYWTDISKQDCRCKYFWWKADFRNCLISALEKKWTKDLLQFDQFLYNVKEQSLNFDPMNYEDSKLYFEKLMKISKQLKRRKIKKQKRRHIKNFVVVQNHYIGDFFILIFFLPSLTEANNNSTKKHKTIKCLGKNLIKNKWV